MPSQPDIISASAIINSKSVGGDVEGSKVVQTPCPREVQGMMLETGTKCVKCQEGSSWKDLYETLYEKTQSSDQSYVAQISQLSKRCADLERELSLLRKTHHTPMLAEAAKAAEVSSAVTPMDLARMMAAGVKELEGKSSEVQEATKLIKRKLGIPINSKEKILSLSDHSPAITKEGGVGETLHSEILKKSLLKPKPDSSSMVPIDQSLTRNASSASAIKKMEKPSVPEAVPNANLVLQSKTESCIEKVVISTTPEAATSRTADMKSAPSSKTTNVQTTANKSLSVSSVEVSEAKTMIESKSSSIMTKPVQSSSPSITTTLQTPSVLKQVTIPKSAPPPASTSAQTDAAPSDMMTTSTLESNAFSKDMFDIMSSFGF